MQKYISFIKHASCSGQIMQKRIVPAHEKADAEAKIAVIEQQLAGLRK